MDSHENAFIIFFLLLFISPKKNTCICVTFSVLCFPFPFPFPFRIQSWNYCAFGRWKSMIALQPLFFFTYFWLSLGWNMYAKHYSMRAHVFSFDNQWEHMFGVIVVESLSCNFFFLGLLWLTFLSKESLLLSMGRFQVCNEGPYSPEQTIYL